MSASPIEQWLKYANSPRRGTEPQVPPDEIDGRATRLLLGRPSKSDSAEYVASWPRERSEIVCESHEAVVESLSRYGALP